MNNKSLKTLKIALLTALLILAFKSKAQNIIYQQNFDSVPQGMIPANSSGQDGWLVNGTTSQLNDGVGLVGHRMGIHSGGQAISGRSLGISFYKIYNGTFYSGDFGGQFINCNYNTSFNLAAFRVVPTTGYENVSIEFKWKGAGEQFNGNWVDYGQVGYSLTGGAPFTWLTTGGQTGNGLYHSRGSANVATAIVSFPASVANQSNFTIAFRSVADECGGNAPQFIIDDIVVKGTPLSTDRTLTVSGAYTGASYSDGSYSIANNTLVTATSGTRPGYNIIGWTGTGSVPSTGTGGSATFNITANSTITWNWQQTGLPNNLVFYNTGGNEQLAFNNSLVNTTTPTFRLSHNTEPATDYQIEINTNPGFGGIGWTQTFNGNYPADTQMNFTFNNNFTPTSGTTYYVRARARGTANNWSSWTTETYSFTYQTTQNTPAWFQTTTPQFITDSLNGTEANASNDVVVSGGAGGGNPILNPSFENSSNWSSYKTGGSDLNITISDGNNWKSDGTKAARMYMYGGYAFSSDVAVISQVVNLTDVDQIIFDAQSHYGSNFGSSLSNGGTLRLIIGGSASDTAGTVVATVYHCANGSSSCSTPSLNVSANIPAANRVPNQLIKFVWSGFAQGDLGGALVSFMVDNVRAAANASGTITSTPIHFDSVQDAKGYDELKWNQTLNTLNVGGQLTIDIQGSSDGVNFGTVFGFGGIQNPTANGVHSFDISGINPVTYPHLRIVGHLNGANVRLHDWTVTFDKENICYKPGISGSGEATKVGISALGRTEINNDNDNWPMVREGGWIALESFTKGFVPNRVEFDSSNKPVGIPTANFVEGMMVYDTTNNCLKVYTLKEGDTGMAWHCMNTQTCPDE